MNGFLSAVNVLRRQVETPVRMCTRRDWSILQQQYQEFVRFEPREVKLLLYGSVTTQPSRTESNPNNRKTLVVISEFTLFFRVKTFRRFGIELFYACRSGRPHGSVWFGLAHAQLLGSVRSVRFRSVRISDRDNPTVRFGLVRVG